MITVLLNPRAGPPGSDGVRERIEGLFRQARTDVRVRLLSSTIDPAEAAREAAGESAIVVAAGGDGTVSSIAAALVGSTTPLGVLPLGTLNHFAKDAKIPLDLKEAVATIAAGHVTAVDVGRLNDRIFLNNASIGLYPNIVELRDELRRHGHRKWPAFMSATVTVLRRYRGLTVALESPDSRWVGRTPFVFVGNNAYTVEGLHLGGRKTLTSGTIVAYMTPRLRSRQLPLLVARATLGRSRGAGLLEVLAAPQLDVALPNASNVRVALDGEVMTMKPPLHFRTDPRALKLLSPPE